MKVFINISHPAQVHFFKHFMWEMERRGHIVQVGASDKDVALSLLTYYGFPFQVVGCHQKSLFLKAVELIKSEYELFKIARRFKPDIFVGHGSIINADIAALLRKPSITTEDGEVAVEQRILYSPFTSVICTPSCFKKDLGKKHIRFNGYKELAYLHPNYFKPDPSVLDKIGLVKNEKLIILRFVAWQATHDVAQYGFSLNQKRKLVKVLSQYGRVFITSESPLPEEFEKYRIYITPEKMHDLLYYATLLVGDSQTMTTEAAVLGTPAIRCNSFVGPGDMGNFIELENKYALIYSFRDSDRAILKAIELLQKPDLKEEWRIKREQLLKDKIDVTQFMVNFVENYPQSFYDYKKGKKTDYQVI